MGKQFLNGYYLLGHLCIEHFQEEIINKVKAITEGNLYNNCPICDVPLPNKIHLTDVAKHYGIMHNFLSEFIKMDFDDYFDLLDKKQTINIKDLSEFTGKSIKVSNKDPK